MISPNFSVIFFHFNAFFLKIVYLSIANSRTLISSAKHVYPFRRLFLSLRPHVAHSRAPHARAYIHARISLYFPFHSFNSLVHLPSLPFREGLGVGFSVGCRLFFPLLPHQNVLYTTYIVVSVRKKIVPFSCKIQKFFVSLHKN